MTEDSTADITIDAGPSSTRVARELGLADEELQAAIDAFRRARRLPWRDFFGFSSRADVGAEEIHVRHGLEALLSAERHVSRAASTVTCVSPDDPARTRFEPTVRALDDQFKSILSDLRVHPDPSRMVTSLKRARRIIPQGDVRRHLRG